MKNSENRVLGPEHKCCGIPRFRLGDFRHVSRIPHIDSIQGQDRGSRQCLSEFLVHRLDEDKQPLDIVCLREWDPIPREKGFEEFLNGLLRVEDNGIRQVGRITQKYLNTPEVFAGLTKPLHCQPVCICIRRRHRGHALLYSRDRQGRQ